MHQVLANIKALDLDIENINRCAQESGERFHESSVETIKELAHTTFGVNLPPSVTANPRKEAELQLRYMIDAVLKQVQNLADINVKEALKVAIEKTAKLLGASPFLLISDEMANGTQIEHENGTITVQKRTGYVKGSGKTGRVKGEKQQRAMALYAANTSLTNSELVNLFMTELKMTKSGARTYAYNVKKVWI